MIGLACNRCVLSGELFELEDLRYTPAGIARIGCKIRHVSTQQEAGMERMIQCDVPAVALGKIAQQLSGLIQGQQLRVEGFLAQRSLRNTQLILHIDNINLE